MYTSLKKVIKYCSYMKKKKKKNSIKCFIKAFFLGYYQRIHFSLTFNIDNRATTICKQVCEITVHFT